MELEKFSAEDFDWPANLFPKLIGSVWLVVPISDKISSPNWKTRHVYQSNIVLLTIKMKFSIVVKPCRFEDKYSRRAYQFKNILHNWTAAYNVIFKLKITAE